MSINTDYEAFVRKHSQPFVDLNYAIVALNGEAGEVAEWHKKVNLRGKPKGLTDTDLLGELGDVLWYLTAICINKGWTLEDVMSFNQLKLNNRVAETRRVTEVG